MRYDRIEQQLDLLLDKPRDATPEEFEEWQNTSLKWWADRQFKIIIIATFVQLSALGFMFSVMFIADQWV
tara:strand:- start:851 stop:1060 length:210 start_codon:yes stop_codon:yes gene_type:complete